MLIEERAFAFACASYADTSRRFSADLISGSADQLTLALVNTLIQRRDRREVADLAPEAIAQKP